MSHYNVNASVPKTLVQHLIRWQTQRAEVSAEARAVLGEILSTEISPELIPAGKRRWSLRRKTSRPSVHTSCRVLHLYYITRFGYLPSKVAFLAHHAWSDAKSGHWPPGYPQGDRRQYDLPAIKKWLRVFLQRFFGTSQFKRSAMPNGPKVGLRRIALPQKRLASAKRQRAGCVD